MTSVTTYGELAVEFAEDVTVVVEMVLIPAPPTATAAPYPARTRAAARTAIVSPLIREELAFKSLTA